MTFLLQRLLHALLPAWRARRIASFDEMDLEIQRGWCRWCRRPLELRGEGPRRILWSRRYRTCHLGCPRCRRRTVITFDIAQAMDGPARARRFRKARAG